MKYIKRIIYNFFLYTSKKYYMDNNWYVYKHIRLDRNEVFYIGIGNKKNYGRAYEFVFSKRSEFWKKIYQRNF